jgi:hypothetical protein
VSMNSLTSQAPGATERIIYNSLRSISSCELIFRLAISHSNRYHLTLALSSLILTWERTNCCKIWINCCHRWAGSRMSSPVEAGKTSREHQWVLNFTLLIKAGELKKADQSISFGNSTNSKVCQWIQAFLPLSCAFGAHLLSVLYVSFSWWCFRLNLKLGHFSRKNPHKRRQKAHQTRNCGLSHSNCLP